MKCSDPLGPWYESHLTAEGARGFKAENWNFFTINHDASSKFDVQEKEININGIDDWASQKPCSQPPGIDLLFARHKNCIMRKTAYPCLPLDAKQLIGLFHKLSLSAQYFHLRGSGGAHSNAAACQTYENDQGNIERTSLIFRIGHLSLKACGSVYAFALTWDVCTRRTVGFLEGFSEADMEEMKSLINSFSQSLAHPLTLPEILLHMITSKLNECARIPAEEAFYREEWRTGLTNMPDAPASTYSSLWNWGFQEFQNSTARANKSLTAIVFLEQRFWITARLARRLIELLDELENSNYEDASIRKEFKQSRHRIRQRLLNRVELLETYEHQAQCVQKRVENLNTVLYTVISEIESKNQGNLAKVNLQIARAVRKDSIPMRTIAYVTLVFLPGALVAAIFGMNFFQFDPETRKLVVGRNFWHYLAITLPVTILVVGVWNAWNFSEKRKGTRFDKHMSTLNQKLQLDDQT